MTLSELLEASQRRFCELLRALCEVSGLTQGRMAKLARSELHMLKERGAIDPDARVGSLTQPVLSNILRGIQHPNYYQLFVLLHVLRGWYESQELMAMCVKYEVAIPVLSPETERQLWHLSGYATPDELSAAEATRCEAEEELSQMLQQNAALFAIKKRGWIDE